MISHKNFESDCKRIAGYIMKLARNPLDDQFDDMILFGKVTVDVSISLIDELKKDRKKWEREINKYLKACCIKIDSVDEYYIRFNIEFDDVDAETEDW